MNDHFRHQGLRIKLVDTIRQKGITDEGVLAAILKIPRHLFLDPAFVNFAYQNKAFPIAAGQTISHPYTVAYQSQLLNLKPREKVLEVGTGSGYQTAVLLEMKCQVFTIERQKELYLKTKGLMPKLGYQCMFFYGDGYQGLQQLAPFDKIIVTAGATFVPQALKDQLKVGGRMVIPVGDRHSQKMLLITKSSSSEYQELELDEFSFVPLLPKKSQ